MAEKAFSGRALVSLLSLVSFLMLAFTGIIMWLEPQGRVAYWVEWSLMGLTKPQWGNIHIMSGLLFIISGIFHVYYNWKPLIKYLSGKVQSQLRHKTEMVLSGLILVIILISGIWSLPPLYYVVEWGDQIKESWIISPDYEPPFGHAEEVSLRSFTRRQGIDLKKAQEALKKANYAVPDSKQTLKEIAQANQTTPMHIYAAIKSLEPQFEAPEPGVKWTKELVEEKFAGKGVGRLTLEAVCDQIGLEMDKAQSKLKSLNIEMKPGDKFKATAEKHGSNPMELLAKLLVD